MVISITAWFCTKCMNIKATSGQLHSVIEHPRSYNPQLQVNVTCFLHPGMLCSLSCASHVSPAVLVKHICGRWLQLKGRFRDDTVQNNERCLKCRGRGADMPLVLLTGDHKRDTFCQRKLQVQLARLSHLQAAYKTSVSWSKWNILPF